MEKVKHTFTKKERLYSKKTIEHLFLQGLSAQAYPLRVVFMPAPANQEFSASAMFVVPKRSFKKAVERNLLKRRVKEAYRLHKSLLYSGLQLQNKKLTLAFIYTGRKKETYSVIKKAVIKLLDRCLK